jgi:hypothetical protein
MNGTLGVEDAVARTNIRRKTQQRYQTAQRTQEAQEAGVSSVTQKISLLTEVLNL